MDYLKLSEFTNYRFLSDLKLGPRPGQLAHKIHQMDLERNSYKSQLLLEDGQGLSLRLDDILDFDWWDEDRLIYLKKQGQGYQILKRQLGEEKEELVLETSQKILSFKKLSQDKLALVCQYDNSLENGQADEAEDDYIIMDELPFFENARGMTNRIRRRLYIYNLKNQSFNPITNRLTDIIDYKISPDGETILFISKTFKDIKGQACNLHIYHIKKSVIRPIGPNGYRHVYADFMGENIILISSSMKDYGLNENPHVYLMDQDGCGLKRLSPDSFDLSFGSSVGSDCRYGDTRSFKVDSDLLYFISTDRNSSYLNSLDSQGNLKKLSSQEGSVDDFDIIGERCLIVAMRDYGLQEIYRLRDFEEIQLSSYNKTALKNKKLSRPRELRLVKDDLEIDGWVIEPVDFDPSRSYPAILNIHGGPKTVFGPVFFHEMQFFANQNYFVVYCNPRGSDGRGRDFADIRGLYGTIDYEDLMDFLDLALEEYKNIDPNRLALTGGSYGGFMTNWIIGHTNRFKVAVSQRSIANWFSFFGTTDIGYYFGPDQQASSPWQNPEKFWHHSPMKYANRVKTPTLFIHSLEDYRCWIAEAMQMFSALKYFGIDSRICSFKGENHDLSRTGLPKHRIKRLEEIINWFDKYIKYNRM